MPNQTDFQGGSSMGYPGKIFGHRDGLCQIQMIHFYSVMTVIQPLHLTPAGEVNK